MKVMGVALAVERGPKRNVNPVPRRLADTSKARALLGFETTMDLEAGLRHLVTWWKSQKNGGGA